AGAEAGFARGRAPGFVGTADAAPGGRQAGLPPGIAVNDGAPDDSATRTGAPARRVAIDGFTAATPDATDETDPEVGAAVATASAAPSQSSSAGRDVAADERVVVAAAGEQLAEGSARVRARSRAAVLAAQAHERGARDAADDAAGPQPDASAAVADGIGAARGATGAAPARDLPAAARILSEAVQAPPGLRDDATASSDVTTRNHALAGASGDGGSASGVSTSTERLRASGFLSGESSLPSWVERLASHDGLAAARRGEALHLDLEPHGLGRIEIRLSLGRDGLRASLITEHEHTRHLLASQQPQLAAALERSELRLESFLVDVGAHAGGDGREAWRDATDPAAFDRIGMVHVAERDAAPDDPFRAATASRGLVSVRA
ncbi:MAG: flagellar hook-length control protein FliK, partial [Deltaproteobacteria bacterium]|nr:flagellar hook-length control protein FliK [Deltaproteobacteria bacterium]